MRARVSSSSADRYRPSGDVGRMPAPLPVSPLAPLGPSPIGKGGYGVPPMSD
jgi:hypothetical protein